MGSKSGIEASLYYVYITKRDWERDLEYIHTNSYNQSLQLRRHLLRQVMVTQYVTRDALSVSAKGKLNQ